MFELSNAYAGAMIAPNTDPNGNPSADDAAQDRPLSPEEILQAAREEAAQILETAEQEAKSIKERAHAEVELEAERRIAEIITEAHAAFGKDLWSVRSAVVNIVESALTRMIGKIGETEALSRAVDQAAIQYAKNQKLILRAAPETVSRLRLIYLGQRKTAYAAGFDIVEDHNMAADRCLLDTGGKKVEISLKAQIDAIKRATQNAAAGASQ